MRVSYALTTTTSAARIKKNLLKATCLLILSVALTAQVSAQTDGDYRSSTLGPFNWDNTSSWERYNGSSWESPTHYPGQSPGTGVVTIRNGATVTINVTPTDSIGGLVVGEGTSGTLRFDNTSGRILTVGANGVLVNAGGTFNASGPTQDGGNDTHTLNIQSGGSFTNNGTVNFRRPDGTNFDVVNINLSGNLSGSGTSTFNNITFNGTTDQTITIAGTISNVQQVTYNNTGTAPNNRINNQSTVFTNALTTRQTAAGATNISIFTAGNYTHDNTATYLVSNAAITVAPSMTVTALQGTMNFAHDNASAPSLTLNGALVVNGGTVNAAVNTNTTNELANAINMNATNASITIQSGTLNVGNTITGYGNLRMNQNTQTITVNGGTLRTERWVIGSGNTDNHVVTINGGLVQILPTVTTTNRVALQFVQGTLTMNGGLMRIGESLTSITGSNLVQLAAGGAVDQPTTFTINNGSVIVAGNSSFTTVANVNPFNLGGGGAANVTLTVGDGSGGANTAQLQILPNLASETPTPSTRNILDMDAASPNVNTIILNSDGYIKVGGGNIGNLRLNGSGADVIVNGGTLDVTASVAMANGSYFGVLGPGTVNIGTTASAGTNTVTFIANPTTDTRFRVDDNSAVVNIGDGNANMVIGNGVSGGNDGFTDPGFVSLELNRGTLNLNGRFLLNDPNARLVMTGGAFNINPQGDNDVTGTLNICHLQRGIVIMTGGTLTIVNPPANAGSGVALLVNPQGNPNTSASLSGDSTTASAVNFSGSLIRFGNGVATASGAAHEGFEVNLHNNHTYGDFEINNPSGSNRFVWFYSTPVNSTINLTNLNVVAGEFRQGRPAGPVSPNTLISSASGSFTLGASAYYRIFNNTTGNPFPSGFASYTFTAGSTVEFSANATQTIDARAYSNLVLAGNGTYTPNAGTTVAGTLTLKGGTLNAGSNLTMGTGSTLRRSNGHILNVTASGGSGYTVGSIVTFSGGGGSGGIGIVTAVGGGGANPTIAMIERGSGYTNVSGITVSGGGGSGATFTITLGGGSVTATDLDGASNNDYTVEYTGTSQTMSNNEFTGTGPRSLRINALVGQTVTLNANRTLTRTGSVGGNLELQSGNFSDNGFILDVLGTLSGTSDGKHTGTTGRIRLNGSSAQSISGIVNVHNIELNNSAGASLSAGAEMTIDSILTLTNGILDVNTRRLTFEISAPTPSGTFSATRMIQTSGTLGALGVRKRYQSGVDFTYPVGVSGRYTPARINLTSATGTGLVTLRPINAEAPTNPGANALQFYWLVTKEASLTVNNVTHEYQYDNGGEPNIVEGDSTQYVPGRNEPSLTNWTVAGGTSEVDEASNPSIIYFNNVSYIDGYFTAGVSAKFNNATIEVFYSGADGDWSVNTTWRIGSFTGPTPLGAPGGNTPVIIGNNYTVTVPDGNATDVPSVVIQSTGTLRFTGSSMPTTSFGLVSGEGRILIETDLNPAQFPNGTFTDFLSITGGTVEYGGSANYTLPTSPSNYRNLVISGGSSTKTFPNQDLVLSGNLTVEGGAQAQISNTTNGNITLDGTASGGGNLTVTGSGSTLRFMNTTARTLNVANNVTVGTGATFDVATTGTAVSNELTIGGSLTNNGTFDMSDGTGAGVRRARVTFTGTSNATISGSGSTTDFNILRVNKGTSQTPILDVTASNFTLSGPTTVTKSLDLQNGTFRLSAGHTITLSTGSPNYLIPENSRLWVNHPSAIARIQSGTSDNNLVLEGKLQLSDGAIQLGNDNTGVAENSIIYQNNTSEIEVSGGTLTVGGAIRPANSSSPTALIYTQSSGTVILSNNRANAPSASSPGVAQNTVADLLIRNASSQFNMSGGLLRVDRRNPVGGAVGAGVAIRIDNAAHNVTGGTVQVISSATNVNQPCAIVSSVPFWNLQIGDGTSYTSNVGGSQSAPQDFTVRNDFTLNTGGEFRLYRVTGIGGNEPRNFTVGGNFTIQNGTFNVGSTSTVTFNGSGLSGQSAPQVITRVGGGTITFRNVTVNNTSSPNTVRLGTNTDLSIIGNWTTTAGTFDAETNTRTVTFNGTTAQNINGTTDFYNLTINNSAGVTLTSGTLGIRNTVGSGGVLTLTSGILNIGSNALVIRNTDNTAIGGTPSASNMIRTNGSNSDAGVTKHYPSTGNFTFPVGTGTNYTPASLNVTASSGSGTITLAPVNSRHPLATNATNALLYYWRVTNTGLGSPTITHTYQYPATLTEEGNTALYQGGYYVPTSWTTNTSYTRTAPTGSPRTVTFPTINVIQGDFTVGEPSAFQALTVYYSFADGQWNTATSWSTTGFSGPVASSTPGTGNPVIIGNNRTITIPSVGTVNAATTEIQSTGTLVIERTTAPSIGTVSGNGRIRYNVTATPTLPSLDASFLSDGTVEYANAATYTLPTTPTTYGNLEISAGTKTLGANTTINGNLTISGGTLNMQGFTLNRASSGGTMTVAAGATVSLTGNFPQNYSTYSLAATSTVNYSANTDQTVAAVTYGNLTFSGTGTNNRTLTGATTVQGNLTINAGKTLVTNNHNLTVGGNFNLAAATSNFTGGTSTVTFNGTGAQTITRTGGGTLTFNNMTVNKSTGSLTLATAATSTTLTVPATLTLTSGAFTIGGSSSVANILSLGGTVTGSGTITGSTFSDMNITGSGALGTLRFTTGSQILRRLSVNRTGTTPTVTLGTNLSVGGSIAADTLTLTSGRIVTGSNALRLVNTNQVGHGSSTAYVDGILSITYPSGTSVNRFFPIGNATRYRPMRVIGNSAANTQVEVEMINDAPPGSGESGINNLSTVRYYRITTNNTFSLPTVMLSLNTNSTDEEYTNPSGLRLASTNAVPPIPSTTWNVSGTATINGVYPSITIQAPLSFSTNLSNTTAYVTAASVTPDNPLPVNMLSVNVSAKNGRTAFIQWETASEQDNLGFVLYRSETENGNFEEIASYQTSENLRGQGTKLTETRYRYEDSRNTQPGKEYFYKLVSVDLDGTRHYISLGEQSVWSVQLPFEYALDQNYPNPFNPVTTIQFSLEKAGKTTLEIYNVLGQKVATLVNGDLNAGAHRYQWNASGLSSGIYFYRLRSNEFVATKKMLLVK